ncbi:MAG: 50S ribosomal protein L18 [Euryarchaeota archaeon]|nr:50S ribosomal protein L18 [Euryarchaeota archaeon]
MATGPRYRVPFRRKREGKTDYRKRLRYMQSGKPRAVFRRSSRYITVQVIQSNPEGDRVVAAANSRELLKMGWKAGTKNLPASYLTGLLCGKRSLEKGTKEAVFDMGFVDQVGGSRAYAALQGLLDAGMEIPHGEGVLPDPARLSGGHIDPEELPGHFEEMKAKIKG